MSNHQPAKPVDSILLRLSPGLSGTAETIATMAALALGPWGARSERIRALAVRIVRRAGVAAKDYRGEVEAIHRWVQRAIRYTRDPVGQERVQAPEHTAFVARAGDCDDFAALEAALLGALGHATRFITIGFGPAGFSHVYLEARVDGDWLPLDPIKPEKPAGWAASGWKRRRAWPVNRAEGFDPYGVSVDGLGDDPPDSAAADFGPLPEPAAWYQRNNRQFIVGPSVPGWNQATKDQRRAWLTAGRAIIAADAEQVNAEADRLETVERVTRGVATVGLSEIERKWDEAMDRLHDYRDLRTQVLALAERLPDQEQRLRATVAEHDAEILAKLGPLRSLLAPEAGLGAIPAVALAIGAAVLLGLLIALIATISSSLTSLSGVIESLGTSAGQFFRGAGEGAATTVNSLGGPLLTIAVGGLVAWWLWRKSSAGRSPADGR